MTFGLPLVFLTFHRLRAEPGLLRGAALGAALAAAALGCAYYGIFAGLSLGLVALLLATRALTYWIGLAAGAAVAGVLVVPVLVPYLRARAGSGAAVAFGTEEIQGYSASLAAYATSPSLSHQAWNQGAPESVFPGVTLLILAGVGIVAGLRSVLPADRRVVWTYVTLSVAALWASFGPKLGLYSLLAAVVPMMSLLRTPVRLGIVVVFALAVLAGFGVRHLTRRRPWLAYLIVPVVAAELFVPWPLDAAPPVPRAYQMLAQLPRGPVVELLFNYKRNEYWTHTRFLFGSTYHWQPLLNGYSDLIPPDYDAVANLMTRFPDDASFAMLKARGVRYVVVHLNDYLPQYQEILLARFPPYEKYLRELTRDDNVRLYEIVGWPPTTSAEPPRESGQAPAGGGDDG